MPALSIEDRHALLGPTGTLCPECGLQQVKHYCRSCDEFFLTCFHLWLRAPDSLPHISDGHRVYVWMGPGEIKAVPDYDFVFDTVRCGHERYYRGHFVCCNRPKHHPGHHRYVSPQRPQIQDR